MKYSLSITEKHFAQLQKHLYPGDNKEAVVLALCGRQEYKSNYRLLVHKLIPIQYDQCSVRKDNLVVWSTESVIPFITEASKKGLGIVKFHSHPTGYNDFSKTDDISDRDLFNSIYGWMDDDSPHGSVIMLPSGRLFGRIISPKLEFVEMSKISIIGDNLMIWCNEKNRHTNDEFSKRTSQAFGDGTTGLLKKMRIGVVGCSGTGSPTIEQLTRLGVGKLVLVDPDYVEEKNINRILNTTIEDSTRKRLKVDVLKESIESIGIGTEIEVFANNVYESFDVISALAGCDVIFGCVDSVDGRHLINHLASFYLIPYIDIGVKIVADGNGGIEQICGAIHYLKPGGGSLQSRNLYTQEELRSAGLFRNNRKAYDEEKRNGYVVNVNVDSPAVISINMYASSVAVNEFLARIHPYRYEGNSNFAITRFSLTDSYSQHELDETLDIYLEKYVGRGNIKPLLNMPDFG